MNSVIVVIMETEPLAVAVSECIRAALGDRVEVVYMTYGKSRLSRDLLMRTDMFVLGLLNSDALGPRAEGLGVGEKFAAAGKQVLIVGGTACSKELGSDYYWDMGSEDALPDRVRRLLDAQLPGLVDLEIMKTHFSSYCRPAHDGHHSRKTD